MSRPSAAPSKLRPDHGYGDRALKLLGEHLKACGKHKEVRALLATAPAKEVRLPGFDLFTIGARSPYEWCVPRPKDEEQVINTYEEYVDRDLGKVAAPERMAKRLYAQHRVAKQYFGDSPRPANYWFTPLAKIIAAAQHFGAPVRRSKHTLETDLLGYTLLASPTGYHSNLRRVTIAAAEVAVDFTPHELAVPALTTRHRLAHALLRAGVDDACLWAANTAIRAEQNGLVNTKDLFATRDRVLSIAEKQRRSDLIRGAALEATEIAQSAQFPLAAIYEAMVPTVCPSLRFKQVFGNPWMSPGRSPRPETRDLWIQRIEEISTEAMNELA